MRRVRRELIEHVVSQGANTAVVNGQARTLPLEQRVELLAQARRVAQQTRRERPWRIAAVVVLGGAIVVISAATGSSYGIDSAAMTVTALFLLLVVNPWWQRLHQDNLEASTGERPSGAGLHNSGGRRA